LVLFKFNGAGWAGNTGSANARSNKLGLRSNLGGPRADAEPSDDVPGAGGCGGGGGGGLGLLELLIAAAAGDDSAAATCSCVALVDRCSIVVAGTD